MPKLVLIMPRGGPSVALHCFPPWGGFLIFMSRRRTRYADVPQKQVLIYHDSWGGLHSFMLCEVDLNFSVRQIRARFLSPCCIFLLSRSCLSMCFNFFTKCITFLWTMVSSLWSVLPSSPLSCHLTSCFYLIVRWSHSRCLVKVSPYS